MVVYYHGVQDVYSTMEEEEQCSKDGEPLL